MASIYKIKGRKTFYLSYRINNKTTSINTNIPTSQRSLAEKFKKEFEARLILSQNNKPTLNISENEIVKEDLNLEESIENFIKINKVTWSPGRLSNVQTVLKIFNERLGDSFEIKKITPQHLSDYITERKKVVTITTIRSDLQILRMFFNSLIEDGVLNKTPLVRKLVPKPIINNILTFSDEELNQIFDSCKDEDRLFYKFLKFLDLTGARPGDILRLKKNTIKMEADILRIDVSKTSRFIDFPVYDELKKFLKDEITAEISDSEEPIFSEFKPHTITRKFLKIKKQLNLKEKYNLKTFRKTFATRWINKGVDAVLVAYMLGHTSVGTTAKYYFGKDAKKILDILNITN